MIGPIGPLNTQMVLQVQYQYNATGYLEKEFDPAEKRHNLSSDKLLKMLWGILLRPT